MKYIAPNAELVLFTMESVILASGENQLPDIDDLPVTTTAAQQVLLCETDPE